MEKEVVWVDDGVKFVLMKYFRSPRSIVYHFRENEVQHKIAEQLANKYKIEKSKVYELALLHLALGVEPDKLAELLRMRTRHDSPKTMMKLLERLVE
jgi:hypothetical protein